MPFHMRSKLFKDYVPSSGRMCYIFWLLLFLFFSFLSFSFSFSYPHPFTIYSKFFIYYFPSRISSTFVKKTYILPIGRGLFWMILGGGEKVIGFRRKTNFNFLVLWASPSMLSMWPCDPCRNVFHIQVLVIYFFFSPPIKLILGTVTANRWGDS